MKKEDMGKFCRNAVKYGAKEAKIITTDRVFTAAWVRYKCQFGCGGYGSSLVCPPYSPKPDETRELLDNYKYALLAHCDEKWHEVKKLVAKLEKEIFLAGYHKALGLGSGPCHLCNKCNLNACVRPEDARPSMEACGIDVFKTARTNGYPIQVVKNHKDKANYYGLVLIE